MAFDDPFATDDTEARTAIMQATDEALIEHGYENLTIQWIGDQFHKSKSLIYQHYGGKDEVLVALLEFLLGHLESQLPQPETRDAHDCLQNFLDLDDRRVGTAGDDRRRSRHPGGSAGNRRVPQSPGASGRSVRAATTNEPARRSVAR
ncbi:MAG: TetR/AcrR family transcriptional regulator [Haloplanus sp.]